MKHKIDYKHKWPERYRPKMKKRILGLEVEKEINFAYQLLVHGLAFIGLIELFTSL